MMMRRRRRILLAGLLLCSAPALADPGKFAVVIGNNVGSPGRTPLRYAESDARKTHAVLTGLGRFTPGQAILHLGANADQVWRSLELQEHRIARLERQGGPRSLLLVYFSGHASKSALELGKTRIQFSRLRQFVRRSRADVRVAVIDACQSGQLVATKGGTPGPGFRISLSDHMASKGYAIITSSTGDELSQESEEIRGSTFTHHFVSALRGAGDDSGDDRVTLAEAYRYAYTHTVAHTAANIGGGQHPMYDFKLSGRGDVVLTAPKAFRSGLQFTPRERGRLLVLSGDRERVVGEFAARKNTAIRVALRPGSYWVYLLGSGRVRRAKVVVKSNRFRELAHASFTSHTPKTGVDKGGLFAPGPIHRVGGGFLLRRMPLEDALLAYGGAASYSVELPGDLEPSLTVTAASAPDSGLSEGYWELGVYPGLRYTWLRFWRLAAYAELRVGYEFIGQAPRDGQSRYTSGFGYHGGLGLRLPLAGGLCVAVGAGAGGRLFELRSRGWDHRLDLLLTTGVAWQWSSRQ